MKLFKSSLLASAAFLFMAGMSSCDSGNSPSEPLFMIDFNQSDISFNSDNYWSGCYDMGAGNFVSEGFSFSHTATSYEWDGITDMSWNGFCPSRVNDNKDYADSWTEHQWACIPQNPYNGIYLVGNSDAEVKENPLENNKCSMRMSNYGKFNPKYAYVTNSSYAYYCAKNGSNFNEKFTASDNFVLHIVGVSNGAVTGHLKYAIISTGQFLDQWAFISMEPLGTVDEVLFYVDSTAKNSYGLTVPAYFCITNLSYNLPSSSEAL